MGQTESISLEIRQATLVLIGLRTGHKSSTAQTEGNEEIYIMGADGTNPTNLSRHAKADRHPDWSPDGTKIAFHL